MLLGIGIDICESQRIADSIGRHGESFAARLLHQNELSIYQHSKQQAKYLAKRFAAKEALAKALGTGIAAGISWQEIEVTNDKQGKPYFVLHGKTKDKASTLGAKIIHLSISDERHYAVAQVVIEKA